MASLSSDIIKLLFPFGFVLDDHLNIIDKGKSLMNADAAQETFTEYFEISKPRFSRLPDYTSIAKHSGELFELQVKNREPGIMLSGTFIRNDAEGLLFLGHPAVSSGQVLIENKAASGDFGIADPAIGLIDEIRMNAVSIDQLKRENRTLSDTIKSREYDDNQINSFFNLSLDFMCLANTDGYFTKINPTFCRVLGYCERELLENPFLSFVHPDDLPSTVHVIERLSKGEITVNFENRYRKSDGSYIVLNWNCTPDASTGVLYATARDMTEHNLILERERELILEKEKSELNAKMLEKLLPPVIASRFQHGELEIADYYPQVSILFADIVDFSTIVKLMPAMVVRKFLTLVFEHFDNIVRRNGCEKIKTIGDGYLAIAGAPEACEDHSERLTNAALEMIRPFVLPDEIAEYANQGKSLSFRIGMHTGAIVGGVLGNSRPMAYDIWGDAVNIASRMQSTGEPGKIHVTSDFVMHLKNRSNLSQACKHIHFEKRGNIEVKHMGRIFTYFISEEIKSMNESRKPSPNLKTFVRTRLKRQR